MDLFRRRPSPHQKFWNEVSPLLDHVDLDQPAPEHIMLRISNALGMIHEALVFEIGSSPSGAPQFVLSANGETELFPLVEEIVGEAPVHPGWAFIALKPPQPHVAEVRVGDTSFFVNDVFFRVDPGPDFLILDAFLDTPHQVDEHTMATAMFILLDATVGERTVGYYLRVRGTKRLDVPQPNLVPLRDLPKLLVNLGFGR